MKANELRIGNWVTEWRNYEYPERDKILVDIQVCAADIDFFTEEERSLYPIPITEEWLEKFGFVKDDDSWVHEKCFRVHLTREGVAQPYEHYLSMWVTKGINYVHDLQNLYFALTGKELKLKDEA